MPDSVTSSANPVLPSRPSAAHIAAGQKMEAHFLSEMLSFSGLNAQPDGFGGGAGEEQFSSFLRREQAGQITASGGIGLAEMIARSLMEAETK